MQSWKDVAAAIIGVALLSFGFVYVFAIKPPAISQGAMFANEEPATLYPACSDFPNGIGGKACIDSDEFERTGRLAFHCQLTVC